MLEDALKRLTEARYGKFGVIRTGFDWYPGKSENDADWAKSIEIAMHPGTAENLLEVSRTMRSSGMPDMDMLFHLGAVPGESLCNATVSLSGLEMDPDDVKTVGAADYEWKTNDDCQCGIRVNAEEIRIEIMDEDQLPLGVAVFGPERFCELIGKAAAKEKEIQKDKSSPKM